MALTIPTNLKAVSYIHIEILVPLLPHV